MKITGVSAQVKNANRVNVMIDGEYRFSLDIFQLSELGIKVGAEVSEEQITRYEQESQFGKLYARALEYALMRPHSSKEIRDYLWRKTQPRLSKDGTKKPGASKEVADRVFTRLQEKGYISDENFARYWVENRNLTKGASRRKLINELRVKGVDTGIIDRAFADSSRSEKDELQKIIAKKRSKYPDDQKLMQYLARHGFGYDDIKSALAES